MGKSTVMARRREETLPLPPPGRGPGGSAGASAGRGRITAAIALLLVGLPLGVACSKGQSPGAAVVPTSSASATPTVTATGSPAASPSPTATATAASSPTPKPTATVSPTPRVTPTVQVSQASGSTMSLKVGQVISLKLQEHVDGGYVWQFSKQPAAGVLSVVSDESLPPSPAPSSTASPPTVGATGIHRWTFRATGAGTTGFTVVERRPNDANPLHDYSLTVVVSP